MKLEEPWCTLAGTLVGLGETSVQPWWNLPRNLLAAQDGSAPENQRHHETWRDLVEPWRNTFWQPKTDLPQRTMESPKAILPRNLYYGWRPQSYCCWGKMPRNLYYGWRPQSYCCWGKMHWHVITLSKSDFVWFTAKLLCSCLHELSLCFVFVSSHVTTFFWQSSRVLAGKNKNLQQVCFQPRDYVELWSLWRTWRFDNLW